MSNNTPARPRGATLGDPARTSRSGGVAEATAARWGAWDLLRITALDLLNGSEAIEPHVRALHVCADTVAAFNAEMTPTRDVEQRDLQMLERMTELVMDQLLLAVGELERLQGEIGRLQVDLL